MRHIYGNQVALVGVGHFAAAGDGIHDHLAAIEFAEVLLDMQSHDDRLAGKRQDVTNAQDGSSTLRLGSRMLALVLSNHLGWSQTVG